MTRDHDILEANVRRLFQRAYEPIQPSEAFREALCTRWLARVRSGVGDRAWTSRRVRRRSVWFAAAVLILVLGGWGLVSLWKGESIEDGSQRTPEIAIRDAEEAQGAVHRELHDAIVPRAPVRPRSPSVVSGLRGRVTETATGLPVTAFEIRARAIDRPYAALHERHVDDAATGAFELADVEPHVHVFVRAEGFAPRRTEWNGGTLDVALERGTALRGRVVDEHDRPVSGALVTNERDAGTDMLSLRPDDAAWNAVRSDAQGWFQMNQVSTGSTYLRATHDGFAAAWSAELETGNVRTPAKVVLRMSQGGELRGTVEREKGVLWPGAVLLLTKLDHRPAFGCAAYLEVRCDDGGRFAVDHLPRGSYNLLLMGESVQERILGMRLVTIVDGETAEVVFVRGAGLSSVRGEVTTATGEPLHRVFLTLQPDGEGSSEAWHVAQSDVQGRFAFDALEPGPYQLYYTRDQGRTIILAGVHELRSGETLDLPLVCTDAQLAGEVTALSTEAFVENALVVLLARDERGETTFLARTSTGRGGAFAFDGIPHGHYRVYVLPAERTIARGITDEIEIDSETSRRHVSLALVDGGGFELVVVNEQGAPLPDVAVTVWNTLGYPVHEQGPTRTNVHGVCALQNLVPGAYELRVEREGYATPGLDPVVVRPFEFRKRVVTLSPRH